MEKQNRDFDLEWLHGKLEKYLILWKDSEASSGFKKQYSKSFIVIHLLEAIGTLERMEDSSREFRNLKDGYRDVIMGYSEQIFEESIKTLKQMDYPSSLNTFLENIECTLRKHGDYCMMNDQGEDILLERDKLELILQELDKIECTTSKRKEIIDIRTQLYLADKKLKQSIRYFGFLKEFAEQYRARFNIQDVKDFWWWFEISDKAVKISSVEEWESLLSLSHTIPEGTEYYEKTEECMRFEDVIPGYVDRMLPEQDELEFEKHLTTCKYCLYKVMDLHRITQEMEKARLEKVPEELLEKAKQIVAPTVIEIAVEYVKKALKILSKPEGVTIGFLPEPKLAYAYALRGEKKELNIITVSKEVDKKKIQIALRRQQGRTECEISVVSVVDMETKERLRNIIVSLWKENEELVSVVTRDKNCILGKATTGRYKLIFMQGNTTFTKIELSFQKEETE